MLGRIKQQMINKLNDPLDGTTLGWIVSSSHIPINQIGGQDLHFTIPECNLHPHGPEPATLIYQ